MANGPPLRLRIDWSEMDLYGHVNNVAFMKYVQAARVDYWEQAGITQMHAQTNKGPMLASTQCNFLKPLFYPGTVAIQTRVEFTRNTSFGLFHQLFNDKGELCAEAHDVIVMYDFGRQQKMEIPPGLRARLEASQ